MTARRYRVLLVVSHPIQYVAPQCRRMAEHPALDVQVAYCSLRGAEAAVDPGFGLSVAWDIPLLDGYPWIHVPNKSPRRELGGFFGLVNPGLWNLLRVGHFDATVVLTGYMYASFWIVVAAAKMNGTAIIVGADAHELRSRDGARWKMTLKRWVWPHIFRLADAVIVPSTAGVALMRSLGIAPERIMLGPHAIDNDWWIEQASAVDAFLVRQQWKIPEDAPVVLFCAKLQPWKRPDDALAAFASAKVPGSFLVFAGDGPLRRDLQDQAQSLSIADRVRFLGFVNQSKLPSVYRASDVLVLPSEHEPFGVVVNEAMVCGLPAIVSDRVGAHYDLVQEGKTGFVFPCGDVTALARVLRDVLSDRERLRRIGAAACQRMETWSPRQNLDAFVLAVERAVACRREHR